MNNIFASRTYQSHDLLTCSPPIYHFAVAAPYFTKQLLRRTGETFFCSQNLKWQMYNIHSIPQSIHHMFIACENGETTIEGDGANRKIMQLEDVVLEKTKYLERCCKCNVKITGLL